MSRHNYTNPAFCQQSEYYPQENAAKSNHNSPLNVHRNELTRSFNKITTNVSRNASFAYRKNTNAGQPNLPPKPGPKPGNARLVDQYSSNVSISGSRYGSVSSALDIPLSSKQSGSGRYALVPVEEIPTSDKGRYAILPMQNQKQSTRVVKSQDNLDRYSSTSEINEEPLNLSDQFCSLPPINMPPPLNESRMKSAFSTDFGSKSFVIFDQKNMQRYEVVPTEENEELVDPNHEIIQMHNGRAHRYAVIPTEEEEEETCLSNENIEKSPPQKPNYAVIREQVRASQRNLTPQKLFVTSSAASSPQKNGNVLTPKKNPIATQKLYELLSTPQKSLHNTPKNSPSQRPEHPKIVSSTPKQQKSEFTPQKLYYDQQQQQQIQIKKQARLQQLEAAARTTAVITPRLMAQNNTVYNETTLSDINKSWTNISFQKTANATATIGAVSLMLILCGFLNSGLSLYMTSKVGREYYLDIGIVSGFAAIALGFLGFKSRECDWLPNRNYISGYILVTVFSLFNCCGLLILMTLRPLPGTPMNDVTTGIILGLSSLILLLTSLGVITSRWCRAPPPDNRVDVY